MDGEPGPPPEGKPAGVGKRARRGVGWNALGAITTNVIRIGVTATLGRLLLPHDFGVVAAGLAVMALLNIIRDIGVGGALIQRKVVEPRHERAAFAISTYFAVGIGGLLALAAPWIADFYAMPDSAPVMRALALVVVLRGLASVSIMLCMRDLEFRTLALVDVGAYVVGSAVSIGCALAGLGPWALVLGYLVEGGLGTAAYLVVRPPHMALRIERAAARELLDYGLGHTAIQIASTIANQGDNLVVGRTLGGDALGFYARAYDLVRLPATVYSAVLGNVLLPAFSRLQHDRERLARSFVRTLFANALVLLPASAALIVLAPEAIRITLGPRWGAMVDPFRILAISMLARTSLKAGPAVARAAGDVYAVAIVVSLYAAAVVVGAVVTSRWGIAGVATSTSGAITAAYLVLSYLGMRRAGVTWGAFVRLHGVGALIAAAVLAAGWPTASALRVAGLPAVATAAIVGALALVIAAVGVAIALRAGHADLGWMRDVVRDVLRRRRKP